MAKISPSKKNAVEVYAKLKKKDYGRYNEEDHCVMLLEVMHSNKPFMSEFCRRAVIDRTTAFRWAKKHAVFRRCHDYGIEVSHANWLTEAEDMKDNEEFNMEYWKLKGSILFQLHQSRRLKVRVNKADTPFQQYQSIMEGASDGEYTATEIKQLMESINVGIRAYESDVLAKRIDEIEEDAKRMGEHSGNNISTVEQFKKIDKGAVQDSVCR